MCDDGLNRALSAFDRSEQVILLHRDELMARLNKVADGDNSYLIYAREQLIPIENSILEWYKERSDIPIRHAPSPGSVSVDFMSKINGIPLTESQTMEA